MVGDGDGLCGPARPHRMRELDPRPEHPELRVRRGSRRHLSAIRDLRRRLRVDLRPGRPRLHSPVENLLRSALLDSGPKLPQEGKIREFPFFIRRLPFSSACLFSYTYYQ